MTSQEGALMIYFKFDVEPVGKGRPRVTRRGNYAHAYTPKRTKNFEETIKFEFMSNTCDKLPIYPKEVPLKVEMVFAFQVPKSYSKTKREKCLLGIIQHTKKPDADNVAKAVCDSLNGLAFEDDSQITVMTLEKIYAEEPYVEIKIRPVNGEE